MHTNTKQTATALTPQQQQAIQALLTTPSLAEIAQAVGVTETTLRAWLRDPVFDDAYRRARRELLARLSGLLAQAALEAVAVLQAIAQDETAPPTVRVMAVRVTLDYTLKLAEYADVAVRLTEMEQQLAEINRQFGVESRLAA